MRREYKLCLLQTGPQTSIAREVAVSMTGHVLNYINLKKFSEEIRFGKKDNALAGQLEELERTRNTLLDIIEKAGLKQKAILLSVVINVEVAD